MVVVVAMMIMDTVNYISDACQRFVYIFRCYISDQRRTEDSSILLRSFLHSVPLFLLFCLLRVVNIWPCLHLILKWISNARITGGQLIAFLA